MSLQDLDRYPNRHLSVSGSGWAETVGERCVVGFGIGYLSSALTFTIANNNVWSYQVNEMTRYQFLPSRMAAFGNGVRFDLPATPIVSFSSNTANDNIVLFCYIRNVSGDENASQIQSFDLSLAMYKYERDIETYDPVR